MNPGDIHERSAKFLRNLISRNTAVWAYRENTQWKEGCQSLKFYSQATDCWNYSTSEHTLPSIKKEGWPRGQRPQRAPKAELWIQRVELQIRGLFLGLETLGNFLGWFYTLLRIGDSFGTSIFLPFWTRMSIAIIPCLCHRGIFGSRELSSVNLDV